MMIDPSTYIEGRKNDSFEQLIKTRDELIESIKDLEKIVYEKEKMGPAWGIHPGPDVKYQIYLEYLSELCKLIKEKYNTEIVWEE